MKNKDLINLAKKAKQAALEMSGVSKETKNKILPALAKALTENKALIIAANKKDIQRVKASGLSAAFIDRLTLTGARIDKMSKSLKALINLKDPVGEVIREWSVPSGLKIAKVRIPIGVILIIYESRPDVTSDCIGLGLKSGNCVILRGGSEAMNSNQAIFKVFSKVFKDFMLPDGAISLVSTTDRRAVNTLLKLNDYIDLVIPRGAEGLIKQISRISKIPVIKHYKGICHIYVDEQADLNMATKLCFNAKVERPGTCNAMESMLVNKNVAIRFLPAMIKQFTEAGVEIRGCAETLKIIKNTPLNKKMIKRAREKDYRSEYLDLILSVRVVEDLKEAIRHINEYGSHHSDAIVSDNLAAAQEFLKRVDSACVYHNASTRFTDGFQFGLGAEIGISTDRLHARGPMALEELTTYKYIVHGSGQIRTG
jgi:glutamate-5-semialdehyde dehydrogenase